MKKPDEIKKCLENKSITNIGDKLSFLKHGNTIPYCYTVEEMCADALALIQQLEAELADTKKAVGYTNGLCDICKHKNEHENECEANDFLCYNCPADCACKECYSDASHYEWRGVQKEETL